MPSDVKTTRSLGPSAGEAAPVPENASLKARAITEAKKYAIIAVYLWAFFAVLHLYKAIILEDNWRDYWGQGVAIVNALIFGKVILIGDALNIGSRFRDAPRIYFVLGKAILFAVLLVAFHIVEDIVKATLKGDAIEEAVNNLGGAHLRADFAIAAIAFLALIPFFAFQDIVRAVGGGPFWDMLFTRDEKQFKLVVQEWAPD